MRVSVTTEQRFLQTPDGRVWTPSAFPFGYWQRYLDNIFDHVQVIARVSPVQEPPPSWNRADGAGVTFADIPTYIGPVQYLLSRHSVQKAIRKAIGTEDAVVLRVGSQIGSCVEAVLERDRPFAVEVVTDPYNIFAPGSVDHPLRPFFRWYLTRALQRQCRNATAAGYVTERYLQERYPPGDATFHTFYAATELTPDAFVDAPRTFDQYSGRLRIVTVGSLAQLYKGVDVLINAVSTCVHTGLDLELVSVGDGRYRPDLERLAAERGIGDRVTFTGLLPSGKAIRDQLDAAHLFALVSKTEGLPGAMIEAMARALPCIGSAVGGIPELLPADDLVPRGDSNALASKIAAVVNDRNRMRRMSALNLSRAREYSEDALAVRRRHLLVHLRSATERWISGGHPGWATEHNSLERV